EMDLVRWPDRVCRRLAERSMASATPLADVRVIEQHRSQRQKRRLESGEIHRAADCFYESGNASVMAPRVVLGVQCARREALHGAWNHICGPARRVYHFARQKLLSRTCVSDALCSGRSGCGARFRQSIELVQTGIARPYHRGWRATCPTGGTDFAARQTRRVHANYWAATAAHRNIAYGAATTDFRRSIWLARNGCVRRACLLSTASRS